MAQESEEEKEELEGWEAEVNDPAVSLVFSSHLEKIPAGWSLSDFKRMYK